MMSSVGILVKGWPLVPGVDAAGVVTKVGDNVSTFKVGDEVCGCTRVGAPGHGTCQEFVRGRFLKMLPRSPTSQIIDADEGGSF